jgi:hypothetical protein
MAVAVGDLLAFADDVVPMREMHVPTSTPPVTFEETEVCRSVECPEIEDPTTPVTICAALGALAYEQKIPVLSAKEFE